MNRTIRLISTIILLAVTIAALMSIKPLMQQIYPLKHVDVIRAQAEEFDLDPYLIAALIHVESKWREDAVSKKGATGLMQLMPDTAAWVAEQMGIEFEVQDLLDPEMNIMMGCWYLNYLSRRFSSFTAALAAYNGGQGNVQQWLAKEQWDGSFESASDIPFWETRTYLRKLSYTWSIYRRIYDKELGD